MKEMLIDFEDRYTVA